MAKQPASCLGFIRGIDAPIKPDGAPLGPMGAIGLHLKFYISVEGRCIDRFQPMPCLAVCGHGSVIPLKARWARSYAAVALASDPSLPTPRPGPRRPQ